MGQKKVVIGMSGGVDSSAAAYLLKKQGYEVIGVTMQTLSEEEYAEGISKEEASCGGFSGIEDARKVAKHLGIHYYVVDFREAFHRHVIDYFIEEYRNGRTPNPCVECNRYVKWQALLDWAEKMGADYVATGHYARIDRLSNGRYSIQMALAGKKDQTYALYQLTQEQLSKTLMPVGAYSKEEIRALAAQAGLEVATKADSQDICFIPDGDYASYIKRHSNEEEMPGNFVTSDGKILGRHKGIIHYTVGQRKGLGLAMGYPVFVLEIRPDTREVVIGSMEESLSRYVRAKDVNFMAIEDLTEPRRAWGKIRYNHKGAWCTVKKVGTDEILCEFDEPQRAITPGQSLVLYEGDYVLAGGKIFSDREK